MLDDHGLDKAQRRHFRCAQPWRANCDTLMLFIIKPYVSSACKVQGTVLGAVRHREAWEGFRKKELSFPKTTLTLFQLPLLESFFFFQPYPASSYTMNFSLGGIKASYHMADRGLQGPVGVQRLRGEIIISMKWPNPQVVQLGLKSLPLSLMSAFFTF